MKSVMAPGTPRTPTQSLPVGLPKQAAGDAQIALPSKTGNSAVKLQAPDFSKESVRLSTYSRWPERAPISASKLAQAGFYYTGNDLIVKCFSCKKTFGDWKPVHIALNKHRELSPDCDFLKQIQSQAQPPNESNEFIALMQNESERLRTFVNWPHNSPSANEMAAAGFYYLEGDKTRCAFCKVVIHGWDENDIPLYEHSKYNPNCPFVLRNSYDECGWQTTLSYPEKQSEIAMGVCIATKGGGKINHEELKQMGIESHAAPKHASMVSVDARLRTFTDWPETSPVSKQALAEAGFFYIHLNDYTKCFHCDGGLCNWELGDDPWREHARWFPHCKYVQATKGDEFIARCQAEHQELLSHLATEAERREAGPSGAPSPLDDYLQNELESLMRSEHVKYYIENGVNEKIIRVGLKQWMIEKQRGFRSLDEIAAVLTKLCSLQRPLRHANSLPSVSGGAETTLQKSLEESTANGKGRGSTNSVPTSVSTQQSSVLLCKICMDNEVGVVFLPCGHLAACPACAVSLEKCPICRQRIMGTVRTYLS